MCHLTKNQISHFYSMGKSKAFHGLLFLIFLASLTSPATQVLLPRVLTASQRGHIKWNHTIQGVSSMHCLETWNLSIFDLTEPPRTLQRVRAASRPVAPLKRSIHYTRPNGTRYARNVEVIRMCKSNVECQIDILISILILVLNLNNSLAVKIIQWCTDLVDLARHHQKVH